MSRLQRTRVVSLSCGVLTVGAVLVSNLTDQKFLAVCMAVLAFGVLFGYMLGVNA